MGQFYQIIVGLCSNIRIELIAGRLLNFWQCGILNHNTLKSTSNGSLLMWFYNIIIRCLQNFDLPSHTTLRNVECFVLLGKS